MASLKPRSDERPAALVLAIGLAGGLLSGLVGVGGGIVMVPLMIALLGMTQHRAHGTSLASIVPTAFGATIPYAIANPIDWLVVVGLAVPAVAFAIVGARLTAHINARVLRRLFALLLLFTAVRLFFSVQNASMLELDGTALIVAAVITGMFTGLVSGTMGLGGGVVMVPVMVILMGIPQHLAQGISLAAIVPTAAAGTVQHVRMGNVDLRRAVLIAASGAAGGVVAAQFAQGLPGEALRVLFAVFALASAQRMLGLSAWLARLPRPGGVR